MTLGNVFAPMHVGRLFTSSADIRSKKVSTAHHCVWTVTCVPRSGTPDREWFSLEGYRKKLVLMARPYGVKKAGVVPAKVLLTEKPCFDYRVRTTGPRKFPGEKR